MALLEDLVTALEAANLGTFGNNIFVGWLPHAPAAAMALYETGGQPPSYIHQALTPAIIRPSVQVMVRDTEYATGRERMQDAYDALCALSSYLFVSPLQEPFSLGRDADDRPLFAVNFSITMLGG